MLSSRLNISMKMGDQLRKLESV